MLPFCRCPTWLNHTQVTVKGLRPLIKVFYVQSSTKKLIGTRSTMSNLKKSQLKNIITQVLLSLLEGNGCTIFSYCDIERAKMTKAHGQNIFTDHK